MVIGFTKREYDAVTAMLRREGYDDTDRGALKQFIVDMAMEEQGEEPPYNGAADRVIENVAAFVKNNPSAIQAGVNLVGQLLTKRK